MINTVASEELTLSYYSATTVTGICPSGAA